MEDAQAPACGCFEAMGNLMEAIVHTTQNETKQVNVVACVMWRLQTAERPRPDDGPRPAMWRDSAAHLDMFGICPRRAGNVGVDVHHRLAARAKPHRVRAHKRGVATSTAMHQGWEAIGPGRPLFIPSSGVRDSGRMTGRVINNQALCAMDMRGISYSILFRPGALGCARL